MPESLEVATALVLVSGRNPRSPDVRVFRDVLTISFHQPSKTPKDQRGKIESVGVMRGQTMYTTNIRTMNCSRRKLTSLLLSTMGGSFECPAQQRSLITASLAVMDCKAITKKVSRQLNNFRHFSQRSRFGESRKKERKKDHILNRTEFSLHFRSRPFTSEKTRIINFIFIFIFLVILFIGGSPLLIISFKGFHCYQNLRRGRLQRLFCYAGQTLISSIFFLTPKTSSQKTFRARAVVDLLLLQHHSSRLRSFPLLIFSLGFCMSCWEKITSWQGKSRERIIQSHGADVIWASGRKGENRFFVFTSVVPLCGLFTLSAPFDCISCRSGCRSSRLCPFCWGGFFLIRYRPPYRYRGVNAPRDEFSADIWTP